MYGRPIRQACDYRMRIRRGHFPTGHARGAVGRSSRTLLSPNHDELARVTVSLRPRSPPLSSLSSFSSRKRTHAHIPLVPVWTLALLNPGRGSPYTANFSPFFAKRDSCHGPTKTPSPCRPQLARTLRQLLLPIRLPLVSPSAGPRPHRHAPSPITAPRPPSSHLPPTPPPPFPSPSRTAMWM